MSSNNNHTATEQQLLHSIHRPTEAQLRWAQFHHRRRAVRVKAAVQTLWQTPASIDQVDGATSMDGNSSTEEEEVGSACSSEAALEILQGSAAFAEAALTLGDVGDDAQNTSSKSSRRRRHGRRVKPKISRGRRALLRVSQRAYIARSLEIQQNGYGVGGTTGDTASSVVGTNNADDDDPLAALFAEDYMKQKKRRIRRRTRGGRHAAQDDQERVQRFEEAFHAMMMNLAANIPKPQVVIETPAKRWTRPPGLESMDTFVDGRAYADLKWGVAASTATKKNDRSIARQFPTLAEMTNRDDIDHEDVHGDNDDENGSHDIGYMEHGSPVRKKFCDIVDEFHQRIMHKPPPAVNDFGPTPTMRLSKYFRPAVLDDEDDDGDHDEKKDEEESSDTGLDACRRKLLLRNDDSSVCLVQERVAAFEDQAAAKTVEADAAEEQLGNALASIDPQLLSEMEQLDPGVIHRLRAFYLGESSPTHEGLVKSIKTKFESNGDDGDHQGRHIRPGLVQRLVERMEKAIQHEHLISADGKLHKAAFAHLLNTYLLEASPKMGSARDKTNSSVQRRQQGSSIQQQARRNNNINLADDYLGNAGIRLGNRNDDAVAAVLPPPPTMRLIDSFVTKMNDECERIVDVNGNFDKHQFETIVARYLAEASGADEATVMQADDLESLGTLQYFNEQEKDDNDDDHASLLSADQIQQFIQNLKKGEEVDPLVTHSGKLHKATFEKLVNRYLLTTMPQATDEDFLQNARSPLALASARKSIARRARNRRESRVVQRLHEEQDDATFVSGPESPGFIKRFIDQIEQATEEHGIVDSRGKLDWRVFEKLVEEYIIKATTRRSVEQDIDDGIIVNLLQQPQRQVPFSPEPGSKLVARVNTPAAAAKVASSVPVVSPTESSFFDKLRKADPDDEDYDEPDKTGVARSVVSDLTYEPGPPPLGHRGDDEVQRPINQTRNLPESSASKRLAKFGGFIKMLYKRDETSADQGSDELRAVAAFRKIRDEHRETSGSVATNSTFQGLPDGIKKVVQNFRSNKLSPKSEEEEVESSFSTPEIPRTPGSGSRRGPQMIEPSSSDDRTPSSYNASEITPERARLFHQRIMERSALIGDAATDRSIIDTDGSDVSGAEMNPDVLAKLMLSPTILTKRHQQAIRAIEKRNWEQIVYLINANPWLAEMMDFKTNQYLLHKLALYGAGEVRIDEQSGVAIRYPAAPMQVNTDIVRLFPSSVHKFDQDGNLPLHMASASANAPMVRVLGDRFPSGATVLNEDGLLPLHLAILACASPRTLAYEDPSGAVEIIQSVLDYFPGAVAVSDNEGNLAIHTAASVLRGEVGVDVIYLLLDEAEKQLSDPCGVRFRNKVKVDDPDKDNISVNTLQTETPTDSSQEDDDSIPCTLIRNDNFHTPLLAAIYARAGWQVIEALVQGRGGVQAARARDDHGNNSLHLIVSESLKDPASALSILKVAPETASYRNEDGCLPIEVR
jgi:ankyrin repeat protein